MCRTAKRVRDACGLENCRTPRCISRRLDQWREYTPRVFFDARDGLLSELFEDDPDRETDRAFKTTDVGRYLTVRFGKVTVSRTRWLWLLEPSTARPVEWSDERGAKANPMKIEDGQQSDNVLENVKLRKINEVTKTR
jgi:hypothetical protein